MRIWAFLLPLSLFFSCLSCHADAPRQATKNDQTPARTAPVSNNPKQQRAQAPAYVLEVLDYVKKNNRAPEGYVGGRTFENRENRLPRQDDAGNGIRYREWDVHAKVQGQNRGAERLITGSDKSAWFTEDHYRHFLKIE